VKQAESVPEIMRIITAADDVPRAVSCIRENLSLLDPLIGDHSINVANYAVAIGCQMGFSDDQSSTLQLAAMLHDIGKILIPAKILYKATVLNNEEWEIVKQHPLSANNMLQPLPGYEEAAAIIMCHHEYYNGRGYPYGMAGDEIPFYSRIISVADAYEAMTSSRPFRKGFSHRDAVNRIKDGSGYQFDPDIVKIFTKRL
jgi:HD-GYP domain-containing protein (c-di-GMP phosphodiesterase class II)